MASDNQIVFYDIASNEPSRTFAPNPYKVRYALNFKKVAYRTQFVDMPDIADIRTKLDVPANRTLPDGSAYHTLPLIHDLSKDRLVGDSFEIALYLDEAYPDAPRLIRPNTVGLTAAFNAQVDTVFTKYVMLSDNMPFPPNSLEKIMGMFASRAGLESLDEVTMSDEAREATFVEFENALNWLAKAYKHVGGTTDHVWRPTGTADAQAQRPGRAKMGPYLDGEEPVYADLIVGAWLANMAESMKPESWKRVRSWHGGLWGQIHDALEPLRTMR